MTKYLIIALLICFAKPVLGFQPVFNNSVEPFTLYPVEGDPEIQREYYGELQEYPDTYQIVASESFILKVAISVPDDTEVHKDFSGIVVRERPQGGIEEVVRLPAQSAKWKSERDPVSGVAYLKGPMYEEPLPPGTYRVEVSTPDNRGQYVLSLGFKESKVGYFAKLGMVKEVRKFHGYGIFGMLRSPLVYQPLSFGVLLAAAVLFWRRRQKRKSQT